ncbi:S1C family serine protease [Klugiella xanthotipulae]|nr:trypsin-like peptidase domain-containing protein [Klugiella xanthotipulae]
MPSQQTGAPVQPGLVQPTGASPYAAPGVAAAPQNIPAQTIPQPPGATVGGPIPPAHGGTYGHPGFVSDASEGAAFGVTTLEGPEKKKNKRASIWIAGLAIGALLGGGAGAGMTALINAQGSGAFSANNGPQTITVNNEDSVSEVTAIAAKAMPSVVTITVQSSSVAGSGSGVVIDDNGHILTNNHVVSLDGAGKDAVIRVHTSDGRILPATVVGTDPYADLAVIKVKDSNLPSIEFGNSEKLNVGDLTVAIGAPLGLPGTVTSGVVSALNRGITVGSTQAPSDPEQDTTPNKEKDPSNPLDLWNFDLDDQSSSSGGTLNYVALPVIQTDASINPGNSGGALLDKNGKLIGINVAIASTSTSDSGTAGSVGLGFAIPVNLAKRVAQDLIDGTKVSHGLLGATISDSSQDTTATIAGAVIRDVTPGGAAAKAGLVSGDTIVKFNGAPVTNGTDLTALVRYLAGGSTAEVSYVRGGKAGTTEVTLGTL